MSTGVPGCATEVALSIASPKCKILRLTPFLHPLLMFEALYQDAEQLHGFLDILDREVRLTGKPVRHLV